MEAGSQIIKKATRKRKKADVAQRELSFVEKVKLAGLIKDHSRIWDLSDALHKRQDAVASSWKSVADEMGLLGKEINYNSL
jgi:hypothetical protein